MLLGHISEETGQGLRLNLDQESKAKSTGTPTYISSKRENRKFPKGLKLSYQSKTTRYDERLGERKTLKLTLCHLHFAGPIESEPDKAMEPSAPPGPTGATISQLSNWNSVCAQVIRYVVGFILLIWGFPLLFPSVTDGFGVEVSHKIIRLAF